MPGSRLILLAAFQWIAFAILTPTFAANPTKIALIISNSAYGAAIGKLENSHRDGERMAATLDKLGFTVVHKRDLDKSAMLTEVAAYVGRLSLAGENAVGFFYYAGHGAANSKYGDNYLIPIGAAIETDAQLPLAGVKLGEVVDSIGATPAKANFVVFDACRTVPISFSVRATERGLRREPQRKGMLVAFATEPGKTATDEGVYAEALSDEMQKPGVEALQVFRAVRRRVLSATNERQFPWTAEGLVEDTYFMPSTVAFVPPTQSQTGTQATTTAAFNPSATDLLAASLPKELTFSVTLSSRPDDPGRGLFGTQNQPYDLDIKGVVIVKVLPGGGAEAAGLQPLDVITKFDGVPVTTSKRFSEMPSERKPGQKVEVQVRRMADNLKARAEGANLPALRFVAMAYRNTLPKGPYEAVRLYRKAADLGDAEAIYHLAAMYKNGEGVVTDKAEAARLFRKSADLGNAEAMTILATLYTTGEGIAPDKVEAARLFRKAADLGNPAAMRNLGVAYREGRGVAKELTEAARWFRKSADLGDTNGLFYLGYAYETGGGVAQNPAEAAKLYRQAADLGNASAMRNLGVAYRDGKGVRTDLPEAARWFRKSADLGDTSGLFNLANAYDNGLGVAQDKAEAFRLYTRLADMGNAAAMNNIGIQYAKGEGVQKNVAEAARYYRKAADLGSGHAMSNLANCYDRGKGVPRDPHKAAEFMIASIKKKNDLAINRAPYPTWSIEFRRQLQIFLRQEGVYFGPMDGRITDLVTKAVAALAAKQS